MDENFNRESYTNVFYTNIKKVYILFKYLKGEISAVAYLKGRL